MEVYVIRVPKTVGKVLLAVSRLADPGGRANKPASRPAESETYAYESEDDDQDAGPEAES